MKNVFGKLKKNFKAILSVIVVLALIVACMSSYISKRMSKETYMGRMISLTPLYDEPVLAASYQRADYVSLDITASSGDATGLANNDVGAYSDDANLTEKERKNKAALEALLASNTRDTTKEDSQKRKNKYKLNKIKEISNDVNIRITANTGNSATGTAIYANASDGSYEGRFLLTGYCPCAVCCGKTNGITASGNLATTNHTIAADSRYSFGTKLIINGQVYTVEDRGGAIQGNHIDIFFATHSEALAFGKQYADVYRYTGSE